MAARMEAAGVRSFWSRPDPADATAVAEWETFMRRSTVADEEITTRVDCSRFSAQRWAALLAHRTQLSVQSPLLAMGRDAMAELMGEETFILRAARVTTSFPETDLFDGLG
jgi:mycothiol S-conjugate amidase